MSLYGAWRNGKLCDRSVSYEDWLCWLSLLREVYGYSWALLDRNGVNNLMIEKAKKDGWQVTTLCVAPLTDMPEFNRRKLSWYKRIFK